MRIGVPKEIKTLEFRVSVTPDVVRRLKRDGHEIFVETNAGSGVGLSDQSYSDAGASILLNAEDVFEASDLIVKVKEPQAIEVARLRPRHTLFTYLHLAADPSQAKGLLASGCTAIAYETVTDAKNKLPLLAPMSQVAGRMAIDVGAAALLKPSGGRGMLLGGAPAVLPAKVVILGGGVAGKHAAEMAVGHRAEVTLFDISTARLEELDDQFGGRLKTAFSTPEAVRCAIVDADLVVGCVLVPGGSAPKLVRSKDLVSMKPGAVLVDVAIDQGGCFESSHATTHADPTFVVDNVIHYCVANMPGAAPLTATYALAAATTPYLRALANKGVDRAFSDDKGFMAGLNIRNGELAHPEVRHALEPFISN